MRRLGILFRGFFLYMITAAVLVGQTPEGGMWMPNQLSRLDTIALREAGLTLSSSDLYSQSKRSIKDAVVSFGGFCTGSFISRKGLLITNHHCAYGAIESHNRRGRNLLEDGFWAAKFEDEIPNPGLEVTLLVHSEEVTRQILGTLKDNGSPEHKQRAIAERCKVLEGRYAGKTGLQAEIRPAYGGNAWHVYLTRTFKDVRLVGAPPVSIARFGGDGAGREWPMHTADFALFRVYADSNNAPAAYAKSNVPYQPGNLFPISIDGPEKGQLTIVPGFPGKTSVYLSSYGIRERLELYNPAVIRLDETILAVLKPELEKSRHLKRQYGSLYSSSHNSRVSLMGETKGIKKLDVIGRRLEEEIRLAKWFEESPEKHAYYGDILRELRIIYLQRERLLATGLYLEAVLSKVRLLDFANEWRLIGEFEEEDLTPKIIGQRARSLQKTTRIHFKRYAASTDQNLCAALLGLFCEKIPPTQRANLFPELEKKYQGNVSEWVAQVFRRSLLVSPDKTLDLLRDFKSRDVKKLRKDPGYHLMNRLVNFYNESYHQEWETARLALHELQGRYEAALMKMNSGKSRAPDANGTLRYTFGHVDDYQPEDGVRYRYYTSTNGILEKYNPHDPDYKLPKPFFELLEAGDFHIFSKNNNLPVNFLATNHTSNGNSGSPVLDGKGFLIGINSARTVQSSVSDFIYDPKEIRNVAVDIRYVLFIVQHYAKAGNLIMELIDPCILE